MHGIKSTSIAVLMLLFLCSTSAQAGSNNTAEPINLLTDSEGKNHLETSAPSTSKLRSNHSVGFGLNNALFGYRYTFLNRKANPYISVSLGLAFGLEIQSVKRPNQSIDIFLGRTHVAIFAINYAGFMWKWHPSGYKNRGLELGLGAVNVTLQSGHFLNIEENGNFITGSIGFKF